jgi:hypothetical protein
VRVSTILMAIACASLAGCQLLGVIGGAAAGAATGAASANGAAAIVTAIAVQTAIDRATHISERRGVTAEQDAVAAAAGEMSVGETRAWEMQHKLTRRKAHGEVRVTRIIKSPLTTCKEVLFSVIDGDAAPAWFATSACQHGDKWKWAAAEPAVERWGHLQ